MDGVGLAPCAERHAITDRDMIAPAGAAMMAGVAGEAVFANAHIDLDTAVLAVYGRPRDLADVEILDRLLTLNDERPLAASGGGGIV